MAVICYSPAKVKFFAFALVGRDKVAPNSGFRGFCQFSDIEKLFAKTSIAALTQSRSK